MKGNHESQLRNEMFTRIIQKDPSERQLEVFNMQHEGTGKWHLESEQFLLWIANEKEKTLLCTEVPGAGKTVLASIVIDYLQQKFAKNSDVAVTYVYFDFRQQLEFSDDLSSLLRQLLQGNPGLHEIISDLCSRHQHNTGRLSEEEILKELDLAISRCSKIFFIIDALDECLDVRVRIQFLIWIDTYLRKFNEDTNIKVLATTRHVTKLGRCCLNNGLSLKIKASREDMEFFLNATRLIFQILSRESPSFGGTFGIKLLNPPGKCESHSSVASDLY